MALGFFLSTLLDKYGLGGLKRWAEMLVVSGASEDEIILALYEHPEFQRAFPEIEARRKMAEKTGINLRPLSADDILAYRTQAKALMRSYGLPPSFYDKNEDLFELIVNDVSLDELNFRLESARTRVLDAPPEVREVFTELFGQNSTTALFEVFVDPDRAAPDLENMIQMAEAGGAARRFGFRLTEAQMLRLERQNLTYGEAERGFAELDIRRGLFDESLFEEGIDLEAEEEGVEAVFGLEGGASEQLRRRAETRRAQTEGGGGIAVEQAGATGFGVAGQR